MIRYYMRKLLYSKYNLLTETAYHEAGHVCIAYLAGFSVEEVSIDKRNPGNGRSIIIYGEFLPVVQALFMLNSDASFFNNLDKKQREKSKSVALRLTDTLVAGPISEGRFKALKNRSKLTNVIMEHTDYKMSIAIAKSLNNILAHFNFPIEPNYVSKEVSKIGEIMTLAEVWEPVMKISRAILDAPNFRLSKTEIEEILENCGFLQYLATFN